MQNKIIDENLILKVIENSNSHQIEFVKIAEKIIFGALSSFHQFENEDREDLLQVIFLKLFEDDMRRIKMWNRKAKFSTYLYRITTFCALDYIDSFCFEKSDKYESIKSYFYSTNNFFSICICFCQQSIQGKNNAKKCNYF